MRRHLPPALRAVATVLVAGTLAVSASALGQGVAVAGPTTRQAALTAPADLPQVVPAIAASRWLAAQLVPQGYVPTASGPGNPDYSSTAQVILALSAANVDLAGASTALNFMKGHVNQFVTNSGADGPGQLALLVLDAVALGASPSSFGGTDLVTRLLATQQHSGPDAGLFGTESQVNNYAAGGYQQGLALAALAAAGVRRTAAVRAGVGWLDAEQCPDGGWTSPDNAVNSCSGSPASFGGPDTNSTAVAAEGLAAQGAVTLSLAARILGFYGSGQDSDGGWSYFPNTPAAPGSTDPDSTALVIQGLLALHSSPSSGTWAQRLGGPVSALLKFQLRTGKSSGAFYFPPAPSPASIIATYQAVPALDGLAFPFGPSGHGYWVASSGGGVASAGGARYLGSAAGLHLARPVVGIATTPDGRGYWLAAADGGVFAYGDARFHGSAGGEHLARPVVGIATTPDGAGYWLVAADGGVFTYGDARFHGSAGGLRLDAPVVGIAATPDGGGYWLVASDGGVFTFGDARFHGSAGGEHLAGPVVGIAATPDGGGYWLAGRDGGVFTYGDARFHGSMPASGTVTENMVSVTATPGGEGYWLTGGSAAVTGFGDATTYQFTENNPDGAAVGLATSRV